ncbi:conserved protein of unknown function [Rhodovastum atsumiense]|uniref:hypothetical protein n=1 Tax=Rhodovastum atsumiense TaxID=504468 RepID=UPI00139F2AFD|nr:hypothetical protein [Rhodovastum atsumiense]CAH2601171.1 conserved protein of unknown function [Rhodovastum atsumiense]
MAQVASNVIDLAAYRARRSAQHSTEVKPVVMPMMWAIVWVPVPVWPVFPPVTAAHA